MSSLEGGLPRRAVETLMGYVQNGRAGVQLLNQRITQAAANLQLQTSSSATHNPSLQTLPRSAHRLLHTFLSDAERSVIPEIRSTLAPLRATTAARRAPPPLPRPAAAVISAAPAALTQTAAAAATAAAQAFFFVIPQPVRRAEREVTRSLIRQCREGSGSVRLCCVVVAARRHKH